MLHLYMLLFFVMQVRLIRRKEIELDFHDYLKPLIGYCYVFMGAKNTHWHNKNTF